MAAVLIAEGDAAHDAAVVRHRKVVVDQVRMGRQGGLGDRGDSEAFRRQHEVGDVAAAIEQTGAPEGLGRGYDGDVRRAEEAVVLRRLARRSLAVARTNADTVVERPSALPTPITVGAFVDGRRDVRRRGVGRDVRQQRGPVRLRRPSARDEHMPGLCVAAGRGALGGFDDPFDNGSRHGIRPKGAAAVSGAQKPADHLVRRSLAHPVSSHRPGRHTENVSQQKNGEYNRFSNRLRRCTPAPTLVRLRGAGNKIRSERVARRCERLGRIIFG